MNIAYWVMYYNKNIFDEQGIEEPTTWEELDAAAAKLKDAGITPYYQTSILFTFQWFQQLVAGTDPELYKGLSTGDVKYTDPEIVEIMNIWLDEQEKGWFSDAGSTTDPAVGLKQGDFAMMNFGSFFNGSLDGAGMVSGEDYDMFVIPAVNADLGTTPGRRRDRPDLRRRELEAEGPRHGVLRVVDVARRADRMERRSRRRGLQPRGEGQ